MLAHPILINRPSSKHQRAQGLCRPSEAVLLALLNVPVRGFVKEDGEKVAHVPGQAFNGSHWQSQIEPLKRGGFMLFGEMASAVIHLTHDQHQITKAMVPHVTMP